MRAISTASESSDSMLWRSGRSGGLARAAGASRAGASVSCEARVSSSDHHPGPPAAARHDAVELGQGLDLIDDDAPHVRSGVRRLLRQLEDALAQLSARRFELAAHVDTHLLQLVQNLGEALRRLRQHRVRLLARLLVDAVHGLAQARPLLLGAAADCL